MYELVNIAGQWYEVRPLTPVRKALLANLIGGWLAVDLLLQSLRENLSPLSFENAAMRLLDPDDTLNVNDLAQALMSAKRPSYIQQ